MTKQFVQVSAHKDSNNFAHLSNLSLMANQKMTATEALHYLHVMADVYAQRGYTIEWIREDFDAAYEEMYGDLFAQSCVQ
jgi:adenine C2-methylase RlmN of 23S rRNA A2503 and tRNA A37